jgi:UPF0716 protein FxsA
MPLLLFLMFPLAEIAAFILVGKAIGVLATLALVAAGSAIGAVMLRDAGVLTALRLQAGAGNPATILAEGGARMLAGLLLLIPGFLTDLAALAVLVPALRAPLLRVVPVNRQQPRDRPDVIEGQFHEIDH